MKDALLGLVVAVLRPAASMIAKLLVDLVKKSDSDLDDKALADLVAELSKELAKRKTEEAEALTE